MPPAREQYVDSRGGSGVGQSISAEPRAPTALLTGPVSTAQHSANKVFWWCGSLEPGSASGAGAQDFPRAPHTSLILGPGLLATAATPLEDSKGAPWLALPPAASRRWNLSSPNASDQPCGLIYHMQHRDPKPPPLRSHLNSHRCPGTAWPLARKFARGADLAADWQRCVGLAA
jgi:hypothetical protein